MRYQRPNLRGILGLGASALFPGLPGLALAHDGPAHGGIIMSAEVHQFLHLGPVAALVAVLAVAGILGGRARKRRRGAPLRR